MIFRTDLIKFRKVVSALQLTDWIFDGDVLVVDVYFDEKSNRYFQVSAIGKFQYYRSTPVCINSNEVYKYGDWVKFSI